MRRLNADSLFKNAPIKNLKLATAADNAQILSQIRELVRRELTALSLGGEFDIKKANILHKLAQTYAIMDGHIEKEHKKYDLSDKTDAEMAQLEADALQLLEK